MVSLPAFNLSLPRDRELLACHLLANQDLIPALLEARQWNELLCLAEFVEHDVDDSLATTDPALFRKLRSQVTELRITGFGRLNVAELRILANGETSPLRVPDEPARQLELSERLMRIAEERRWGQIELVFLAFKFFWWNRRGIDFAFSKLREALDRIENVESASNS